MLIGSRVLVQLIRVQMDAGCSRATLDVNIFFLGELCEFLPNF